MLATLLLGCQRTPLPSPVAAVDWPAYGGDAGGSRHSPADLITRENVAQLRPAWSYRTRETEPVFAAVEETALEATPIVVDGTMFLSTPLGRVIALDPATGRERWIFEPSPPVSRTTRFGDFTSRGVSTWLDPTAAGGAPCRRRIVVGTIDARLIALDAQSGRPCEAFGERGSVDLRRGLRIPPYEHAAYEVTSPPAVVGDLIITGSAIADNGRVSPASGEVRAFDARTGALRWTWHPIPIDATDPAFSTWSRHDSTGAANAWSILAADLGRDLVFVPTSSASPDYYGAHRLGANRYANSIVALRASTGRLVWHFQTVHHDLWDYDNASPPVLVSLKRGDRQLPAVLQATKTGMLFVLDRETGAPLFPVEERPAPPSDIPGETASPTQPFTSVTPPLSPHRWSVDEAWGPTPADREACRAAIVPLRNEGIFTPPSERGTLVVPSNIGGAHWGGVAVDPVRQIAVVPVNRIAAVVQLIAAERWEGSPERSESARLGYEVTRMRGTPYVMRRRLLLGPSGLPCTPPPFGALVAVSLRTGERLWEVPLGRMRADLPAEWGSPNLGGAITTASGLVFIAATLDRAIRAFDIETGRELWRAELPAGGRATPMTYRASDGRQYVVIAAGGGDLFGKGDWIIAFALPR